MDAIDPVWLFGGIALVTGFLIGGLVYRRLNPASGDIDKLNAELEKTRAEMESYKASVNRHFNKTSDLVNELTQDYVRVYQHLAEGAQDLGNNSEFARALEQSQGRVLISVADEENPLDEADSAVDHAPAENPQPQVADLQSDGESTAEIHEHADRMTPEEKIHKMLSDAEDEDMESGRESAEPATSDQSYRDAAGAIPADRDDRVAEPAEGEQLASDVPPTESPDDTPAGADEAIKKDHRGQA